MLRVHYRMAETGSTSRPHIAVPAGQDESNQHLQDHQCEIPLF